MRSFPSFSGDIPSYRKTIILTVRLPIVLMALFTGIGLSSSGASMQGLFKNPLVDPFIIGISAGGAFGWVMGGLLTVDASGFLVRPVRILLCLSFSLGTVLFAYGISRSGNRVPVANLLLAGIAASSVLTSATYLLIYFYVENPAELIFSLMGTCGNSKWSELTWVAPTVVVGSIFLWVMSRDLNAFSAGEEGAMHLGVDVERSKAMILLSASVIAAISVPFCGIIGFVGLIIPHAVRRFIGPDHRLLVPMSALAGGGFLILSDAFSRSVSDVVIPLGIVTGLVGGAFFLYLLIARRSVN
jgi:iron complex transport system permease protein